MRPSTILFDIDGTLTATNAVDDECYCEAIASELPIGADVDWSGAPYVTDTGIAHWLWEQSHHRSLTPEELSRVRSRFVELLRARLVATPERFAAIPGACDTVARLRDERHTIGLATGAWAESARLKLQAARIDVGDTPLASADDGLTREEILMLAAERCGAMIGASAATRVVSVGDALWDVAAARRLFLPFVGIAAGENAERLLAAGASHVLPDLSYDPLMRALESAAVPALD